MASQVMQVGLASVSSRQRWFRPSPYKWFAAPSIPWFVVGFIAMVILNSVVTIPVAPKAWIALGTTLPGLHGAGRHG